VHRALVCRVSARLSVILVQEILCTSHPFSKNHDVTRTRKAAAREPRWKLDVFIYNLMIDSLSKMGYLDEMGKVVEEMTAKGVPKNHITYTALYSAYANHGDQAKADKLWQEMIDQGIEMDLRGYNSRMQSYSRKDDIDRVLDTYAQIQAVGFQPDEVASISSPSVSFLSLMIYFLFFRAWPPDDVLHPSRDLWA